MIMKKNKKKFIILALIILCLATLGYLIKNKTTVLDVEIYEVKEGKIEKYIEEIGNVKLKNSEIVYANLPGKVTEVLIDVGDEVTEGSVLVRLDSEDQVRDINILEAQKAALRAQYNQALTPVNVEEIKKIELVISDLEKRFNESNRLLTTQKELLDAGIISNQDYQDFILNHESLQTELDKAKLDLELLKKPISPNISAQFEANLLQLDLQIDALKSNEGDFIFTAPFKGTILSKNIAKGSYVQPGTILFEIGSLDELYIESDVLVQDISGVVEGAVVKIENSDLDISEFKGIVTKIHPQAFSKISDLGVEQKRIKIEIEIEKLLKNIKPGYELDIKIITQIKDNVLVIPENALFEIEGKDYVFIIDKGITALRAVEKGIESDRQVEILSGLVKGDLVILSPDENLSEGKAVR